MSTERASKIILIEAWQIERGRDWRAAAQFILERALDVLLLGEMD